MGTPTTKPKALDPWGAVGATDGISLFALRLLGQRYAFEAAVAHEVIRLGPLTRLPAAQAFLLGVFNHRGEVLAVLDLAQLLAEESTSLAHGSRAVIVQSGEWRLAVVAEALEGLISLPTSALEPPPTSGPGPSEFLKFVATTDDGPLAILDLPRLIETAHAKGIAP
jgi:purine-binding chemotaxis protein CheW